MRSLPGWLILLSGIVLGSRAAAAQKTRLKPYKAPRMKYVDGVTWGAYCEKPEGKGLAFGGQDRKAPDGRPHTRVKRGGKWVSIAEELRKKNPLQKFRDRAWRLRTRIKDLRAGARYLYFEGKWSKPDKGLSAGMKRVGDELSALVKDLKSAASGAGKYEAGQASFALGLLAKVGGEVGPAAAGLSRGIDAEAIKTLRRAQMHVARAAEALDAEPPARVASAIAFDAKTGLYLLFGGDHYDYLTNDTWVFDPKAVKWTQRHPKSAPEPRGDHKLVASGDGKVKLSGGYAYRYSLGYMAAQYGGVEGGEWTYDIAADTWTGAGKAHPATARVYRQGPFLPEYFLTGEKPDAAGQAARLKSLPANTWVELKQSHKPRMNRDWGTAVFDFDRDLILFWSGGHSAHGGTDVLHYHPATNRWELPCPVELPLGQLYVGGEGYPAGFNFNLRPWMNGHTRKTYGYDRRLKKMVFVAPPSKDPHFYLYDSARADWSGRAPRPASMNYYGAYHTLFICCSPVGTYVWTGKGQLMSLDEKKLTWEAVKLTGVKLPRTSVDVCAITYDPKRDRLLCMRGWYGKAHDGQVYAIDRKTWTVKALNPAGREAMKRGFGLRESVYYPEGDLILISVTGKGSLERTMAYDCAKNRWVSLKIGGLKARKKYPLKYSLPYSPSGNHSIGLRYDPERKLFWAINNYCRVWVMRLDLKSADLRPLGK